MLQPQQSKASGTLYYDESPRAFIPPPVAEIKALTAKKEQDYLLGKNTENEIEKVKRNLPSTLSPEIYNRVVSNIDTALSGVNAENYSDKVLDIQQVANDMVNKWGGNELVQEQQQVSELGKYYDTNFKEGKIESPEMANFYKQRDLAKRKPLMVDDKGMVSKPNIAPSGFAEYQSGQEKLNTVFKDWEASNKIIRNADGTIAISDDIRGYFGIGERESISEEELIAGGVKYLQNDEKYQAYLKDKTDFEVSKIPPTAESLNQVLSPTIKSQLLGNPNASTEDIQQAINSGAINPTQVLKQVYKADYLFEQAQVPSAKYSYDKEKLTTLKDDLLIESLKAQQKINDDVAKSRAEAVEESNVSVIVSPFMTQEELNPADIKVIQTVKKNLANDRTTLLRKVNSYQKMLDSGASGYSIEQVEDYNKEVAAIDAQISQVVEQEKSLQKVLVDNGVKAGVDFSKEYRNKNGINRDTAVNKNIQLLTSPNNYEVSANTRIDVTDMVKVDEGGFPTVNAQGRIYKGSALGVTKENGKYYVIPSSSNKALLESLSGTLFETDGGIGNRFSFKDSSKANNYVKVPSEEKYYEMMINAYNDDVGPKTWYGGEKVNLMSDDGKYILDKHVLDNVKKVKDKQGDFKWTIGTPLSYLSVSGDLTKDSVRAYVNLDKNLNRNFKVTAEQYSARTLEGTEKLGDHLKKDYGIPDLSDKYIDWSKSGMYVLLEQDRQYGQKYGMRFVLTEDGRDSLNDNGEKAYASTNQIKIVTVNPDKSIGNEQAEIASALLKSYPSVKADSTTHGLNISKEMGVLYVNQMPEGKALDSANLYTMSAGDSRTWDVRGDKYKIRTTAKDGEASDLMNVNFHLGKTEGGVEMVYAKEGENYGWYDEERVEKDLKIIKYSFDSPTDIKAVVGKKLLDIDSQSRQASEVVPAVNAFSEYLKAGYRSNTKGDGFTIKGYERTVKTVSDVYKGMNTIINITTNSGKSVKIESRVPMSELYDLKEKYNNRISPEVDYPYINKNAVPFIESLLTDNPVTITGGFRGEKSHSGLKDSAKDSLHKYGYGIDIRSDEEGKQFKAKLQADPELAKKYGIINVLEHGNPVHIHLEFSPTTV